MQPHYDEVRRLGGELLVVSFSKPERVAAALTAHPLPFPVVSDTSRESYRAFGLGRTSWRAILDPRTFGKYVLMMLRGWLPRKPNAGEDVLQLGGDFVLDADRRLVYAYRSADPTDRPPPEELVRAVRTAAG